MSFGIRSMMTKMYDIQTGEMYRKSARDTNFFIFHMLLSTVCRWQKKNNVSQCVITLTISVINNNKDCDSTYLFVVSTMSF